tara:strand:- start:2721 stop:3266 length:546 start_codon:yes stop_codon:yes gene_type:complete
MKENQIELIKRTYNTLSGIASEQTLKEFKEVFPEVFELEIDKDLWYTYSDARGYLLKFVDGKLDGRVIGITPYETWIDVSGGYMQNGLEVASEAQAIRMLSETAVLKGFVSGATFKDIDGDIITINSSELKFDFWRNQLGKIHEEGTQSLIFNRNVWAEIVEVDEMTTEEAENKYKIKIVD